jgi:hypothetical protein
MTSFWFSDCHNSCIIRPCKKYPGLSSVAAEKTCVGGRIVFNFTESHIVGAQKNILKNAAQFYGIIFSMLQYI